MICPRCKTEVFVWIMSKFNTEQLCIDCKEREENHPLYAEADRAEIAAINAGNLNFVGIGAPKDLYQPRKEEPKTE